MGARQTARHPVPDAPPCRALPGIEQSPHWLVPRAGVVASILHCSRHPMGRLHPERCPRLPASHDRPLPAWHQAQHPLRPSSSVVSRACRPMPAALDGWPHGPWQRRETGTTLWNAKVMRVQSHPPSACNRTPLDPVLCVQSHPPLYPLKNPVILIL